MHDGKGGLEHSGGVTYHSTPPFLSSYPHQDRKLEQTWVRDEANHRWTEIPPGHSIPTCGKCAPEELDKDGLQVAFSPPVDIPPASSHLVPSTILPTLAVPSAVPKTVLPRPKPPTPYQLAPPAYTRGDNKSHYWCRFFELDGKGGVEVCGGVHYHSIPPFLSDCPYQDSDTEQTWVRDEANTHWAEIPAGHAIPAYGAPDPEGMDEYGFQVDEGQALIPTGEGEGQAPISTGEGEGQAVSELDESSPSGSDFSADRTVVERKRKREREAGRDDSDTELDDLDADEELRDEVVEESPVAGRRSGAKVSRAKVSRSKKSKGKRPQRHTDDEGTEESGQDGEVEGEGVVAKHVTGHEKEFGAKRSKGKGTNVEGDGDSDGEGDRERGAVQSKPHYTRGRWPKDALARCDAFGDRVAAEARIIAQSLNKDVTEVMLCAGLGLKFGKKGNAWNKYQTWYPDHYPKPTNSSSFIHLSLLPLIIEYI
jgi:hypothetical protein